MRRGLAMTLGVIGVLAITASSDAARLILVAGGGTGGDGSPAREAKLSAPFGVALDRSGTIYFVEYAGNRVRKIDSHGIVTTIAGTGERRHSLAASTASPWTAMPRTCISPTWTIAAFECST
jgi:hypothetical protein